MDIRCGGINAVVIGGGTGSFTILSALKNYIPNITSIVNMVDDGGSTGVLRDELGVLPPGDVRQCLVALSRASNTWRELFNYRFECGAFGGHAFGNLFLSALEKITGSFAEAVKKAEEILETTGHVLPVTLDDVRLCARLNTNEIVEGQNIIRDFNLQKDSYFELFLKPNGKLNPEIFDAIRNANIIIVCPGLLHASIIPTFLVDSFPKLLQNSNAKKIYICNLVTKPGQTDGFKVHDFVSELEKYTSNDFFDYVIYNNKKPDQELLDKYAKAGEKWVEYDLNTLENQHYKSIGADLISDNIFVPNPNDKFLIRTLIRHNAEKTARIIMSLYFAE